MKQYLLAHLLVLALAVGSVGINSAPENQGSLNLKNIQYLNAQVTKNAKNAQELLASCHTIPFDPEYVAYAEELIYNTKTSTPEKSTDLPSIALYPLYLRLIKEINTTADKLATCRREAEQAKSETLVQQ